MNAKKLAELYASDEISTSTVMEILSNNSVRYTGTFIRQILGYGAGKQAVTHIVFLAATKFGKKF